MGLAVNGEQAADGLCLAAPVAGVHVGEPIARAPVGKIWIVGNEWNGRKSYNGHFYPSIRKVYFAFIIPHNPLDAREFFAAKAQRKPPGEQHWPDGLIAHKPAVCGRDFPIACLRTASRASTASNRGGNVFFCFAPPCASLARCSVPAHFVCSALQPFGPSPFCKHLLPKNARNDVHAVISDLSLVLPILCQCSDRLASSTGQTGNAFYGRRFRVRLSCAIKSGGQRANSAARLS